MNKKILRLAIPNIVSNITIPLLGMVDLALMGHLDSVNYIGAIALGAMIFNFLYWGFGFLRMGTSGFTAQAYGRRSMPDSIHTLARALLIAFMGALLLILLQYPIEKLTFWLISSEPEVEQLARSYFYIRIWAAPATIGIYALIGWYVGMQNTRFPMFMAILINLVNIGLNILFVFGLNMKSDGVALGTLLAQYSGLFFGLFLFRKYYGKLLKHFKRESLRNISILKEFMTVNKDIFIRTLCIIIVFTFFTSSSAAVNKHILAVNTVLLQLFFVYSYFVDGFAYAAEALTGKYFGAQDAVLLKKSVKKLFAWGLGIAVVFSAVYGFGWRPVIWLLTDNTNVINAAGEFSIWIGLMPLLAFASFLWDGIYIGATASVQMRNSMLIATLVVFFPVFYILRPYFGNHALWIALLAFLLTRGIAQYFMANRAVFSKVLSKRV
ncbi:DNA-damage-inducible protein F [Salinivirga cyanobacteriivorans]|uniref:DNA-damage-inducible protein F n=1 Tax=Salinivirga cyanobacteriivorans TaxID=1307839 RepID=A0A0S2I2L8_9BACT|nr:MATE family efflux transporter [Salinivirga cyanobacteriivorans]ALO16546.1 DNA-damage-inducible protein F [Salinivirga cyanobacteriivorans]